MDNNNKMVAPDGWYDGKLVGANYEKKENGAAVLNLEFNVGESFFHPRESIWLVSAPTGDAAQDANRKQWTRESVERLKEVYPEVVADGKLQMLKLLNPDATIAEKFVRVRVTADGQYAKAKVYPNKGKKPKVSKDEAMKMLMRDQRALAAFGISVGEVERSSTISTGAANGATAANGGVTAVDAVTGQPVSVDDLPW